MTDHAVLYGLAIATNLVFRTNMHLFQPEIERYSLAVPVPIRAEEVRQFNYVLSTSSFAVGLSSGWSLSLDYGKLTRFESPVRQHPELGPAHITSMVVTEAEAVEIARNYARKSGLSDRELYLHLDPRISSVPKMPGFPFFTVEWQIPNEWMGCTFECTVDCRDGSVVGASFLRMYRLLVREEAARRRAERRPPPPPELNRPEPAVEDRLLKVISEQLSKWAPNGGYPTNWLNGDILRHRTKWEFSEDSAPEKSWRAVVWYTNDYRGDWVFVVQDGRLTWWYPPDAFFEIEHPDIEDFTGMWRMSERQAADLVRRQVRKMGFPRERLEFLRQKPTLAWKPRIVGTRYVVPRIRLLWQEAGTDSEIEAEVDADAGRIKLLGVRLEGHGESSTIH